MTPPKLTDEQCEKLINQFFYEGMQSTGRHYEAFARAIEAARDAQWQEMLSKQEPVGYFWKDAAGTIFSQHPVNNFSPCFAYPPAQPAQPDHTALLREVLDCGATEYERMYELRKKIKEALNVRS